MYGKTHREKVRNTGKTQGKHREFYLGWNVATLVPPERTWNHWLEVLRDGEGYPAHT